MRRSGGLDYIFSFDHDRREACRERGVSSTGAVFLIIDHGLAPEQFSDLSAGLVRATEFGPTFRAAGEAQERRWYGAKALPYRRLGKVTGSQSEIDGGK